ncbi:hypothetical protein [Arthrobacter sp. ISL-72]|uniref:hypothetical protein n=1 Tax=Arthrobacter sp. ISL-72 TaxID=2819114 RepID=UPI001BE8E443|nr:hypothetical protein [Arthrobacter sp. ISL-72]MBT2595980.1 hypothetical protein [Arthrobacter sp. ISL-72]
MANEIGFRKVMLICGSGLLVGIVAALLLAALLPQTSLLPMVVGIIITVVIAVPALTAYFKRRM